jgi:hypothetical protein
MEEDLFVTAATRKTIERYFEGFNAKDIAQMSIAENVHFKAPLTPEPVIGLVALRPFLEKVFASFERIEVRRTVTEGEFACVMIDYFMPDAPPIPMVDCFRVVDGMVVEILPYFDTKLLSEV